MNSKEMYQMILFGNSMYVSLTQKGRCLKNNIKIAHNKFRQVCCMRKNSIFFNEYTFKF